MAETDEETIREAFEKWFGFRGGYTTRRTSYEAWLAFANLIPGGLPAAAALLRGEACVVPKELTRPLCHALFGLEPTPDEYADYADFLAATPYKP